MQDNQRQTHYAYLAGIMDADGCFMISKHKRKTHNRKTGRAIKFPKNVRNWSHTYMPTLKIAMIEKEAIEFIINDMNYGHVYISGARKSRPNSKAIYQWYLRAINDVIDCLEKIIPYLKVKRNRAEFLLEFCKKRITYKNPCYRGVDQEELDYREDSYWKMRKLNGTKVAATTEPRSLERGSDSLNS